MYKVHTHSPMEYAQSTKGFLFSWRDAIHWDVCSVFIYLGIMNKLHVKSDTDTKWISSLYNGNAAGIKQHGLKLEFLKFNINKSPSAQLVGSCMCIPSLWFFLPSLNVTQAILTLLNDHFPSMTVNREHGIKDVTVQRPKSIKNQFTAHSIHNRGFLTKI